MKLLLKLIGLSVPLLVTGVRQIQAATIYSTLGPEPYIFQLPSYTPSWGARAGTGGTGTGFASPFSFGGSMYQLQSISLDIAANMENSPNLQIGIAYDNGGVPSDTFAVVLDLNPTFATQQHQVRTYTFSLQPILQPNTTYWLTLLPSVLAEGTDAFNVDYSIGSSPLPPNFTGARRDFTGGSWGSWNLYQDTFSPAFRLDGIAVVPEPSTWALLALGGAAFAWGARRRHKR